MMNTHKDKKKGFTLLELIVVLFLMGIMLSYVTLNISVDKRPIEIIEEEKIKLEKLLYTLINRSIFKGIYYGIIFNNNEYEFVFWDKEEKGWVELEDLPKQQLDPNIKLEILENEEGEIDDFFKPEYVTKEKKTPQVYIFPSGEITEFTINIKLNMDLDIDLPVIYFNQLGEGVIKFDDEENEEEIFSF